MPAEGYSEEAHAFVRACLDKNPNSRPSYNMLLRHPWLAPLMQPPTESADEHAPSDVHDDSGSGENGSSAMTEDKEAAEWVNKQIKLREDGLLHVTEKPALHAVALDKVGTGSENDPNVIPQTD